MKKVIVFGIIIIGLVALLLYFSQDGKENENWVVKTRTIENNSSTTDITVPQENDFGNEENTTINEKVTLNDGSGADDYEYYTETENGLTLFNSLLIRGDLSDSAYEQLLNEMEEANLGENITVTNNSLGIDDSVVKFIIETEEGYFRVLVDDHQDGVEVNITPF